MREPPRPRLPETPACPFCGGRETERLSLFGGQLSLAQFWCRRCRTGFDVLKWRRGPTRAAPPEA
jgi:hypothetical protein